MGTSIDIAPETCHAVEALERQPDVLAERLRELQAYGGQRSAEFGLADDDPTSVTRRILKGKAE